VVESSAGSRMPPNSAQPAPDRTREHGEIWIRVRSHARWFDTPSGCAGPDRKAPLSGCAGPRSRPGDRGFESCSLPATSPLRTRLPSPFATGTDLLVRVPARWDDAEPPSRPPPKRPTKVRATTPRLRLMLCFVISANSERTFPTTSRPASRAGGPDADRPRRLGLPARRSARHQAGPSYPCPGSAQPAPGRPPKLPSP
jgi:hypothetical protein